jgi:hypothetical protein
VVYNSENKVDYKVLAKSLRFIRKLSAAVLQGKKTLSNWVLITSYSYIYVKSIIMAKIYRGAVKLMLVFNIKVETGYNAFTNNKCLKNNKFYSQLMQIEMESHVLYFVKRWLQMKHYN